MTTTTSYGTWVNHIDCYCPTVEQHVALALEGHAADFDIDGLVREYRAAINDALPPSVTLNGDTFYGPYHEADRDFSGYPLTDEGNLDIKTIVESVDFWSLAEKYDRAE